MLIHRPFFERDLSVYRGQGAGIKNSNAVLIIRTLDI